MTTAAPSALDSRIGRGSATVMLCGVGGERVRGRGHEVGVEGAGDGQRPHPGAGRRLGGQLLQCVQSTGGDDLAGAVAVGRGQPGGLDSGDDLVGVAAEDGGHAGRGERAGGGHLGAAAGGEGDRRERRQRAGHGGRGQLTDAVAGDDAIGSALETQLTGRDDAQRYQQRLGDGGVLDVVGGGSRAEPGEVEAGDLGELGDLLGHAGQLQPRSEHAGRLRTLARSKYCDHTSNNGGSPIDCATATRTGLPARFCRYPTKRESLLRACSTDTLSG